MDNAERNRILLETGRDPVLQARRDRERLYWQYYRFYHSNGVIAKDGCRALNATRPVRVAGMLDRIPPGSFSRHDAAFQFWFYFDQVTDPILKNMKPRKVYDEVRGAEGGWPVHSDDAMRMLRHYVGDFHMNTVKAYMAKPDDWSDKRNAELSSVLDEMWEIRHGQQAA